MQSPPAVRVLIVAEHASAAFGGEAFLPLHYFRVLRERGVQAWLLCHERVRSELLQLFPDQADRLYFNADSPLQIALWRHAHRLPERLRAVTIGSVSNGISQVRQRSIARELVREHAINVVHVPIPVSPRLPSYLYDLGAPVVMGPMNGGMTYPVAFRSMAGKVERLTVPLLRLSSGVVNTLIPGKRKAAVLLVANERTERALPSVSKQTRVEHLVENGVDLRRFDQSAAAESAAAAQSSARCVFVGRLVDWKRVDLLLSALVKVPNASLDVIGDGPELPALQRQAQALNLTERVKFHGFLPQAQVASLLRAARMLLLPSIYECGGAVVLEAMAMGLPVIATNWGGPADYLDESCGILIEPSSEQGMVDKIAEAMVTLHQDPELCKQLGSSGQAKVKRLYDWERKIDRMLEIYAQCATS